MLFVQRLRFKFIAQNNIFERILLLSKISHMERVETLCDKLKQQIIDKVQIEEMLLTVQMLQSELNHLQSQETTSHPKELVAVHFSAPMLTAIDEMEPMEDRIFFDLDIDEAAVEAELEEMKRIAESKNNISLKNRKPLIFDPVEDTPTLYHQKPSTDTIPKEVHVLEEKNTEPSLNDTLKENKKEISELLQDTPIKDLRKAFGVNDRYLFINELFNGDEVMFDRSIKTINAFSIYPEAEYWIRRELKVKLAWDEKSTFVQQFDQLVKRRFA